ncbi:SusC/RagA family TonB-linked outer membrane protein, partial [Candidatus Dependentiae bacterium]|nr:SusC/RagA family TonB-linked outer membrane protein [Candidatus Dependentiae bacterium]
MRKVQLKFRTMVFLALTFLIAASVSAQDISIKGNITALDDGTSLPGANIVVKGTTTGTITNSDGNYSITAPSDGILVFSFVGYSTQEIQISGRNIINVIMEAEIGALDEVFVIGYGTIAKKDLVSSVSQVKSDVIENQPVVRLDQLLQGKATGVQVTSNNGAPGSGATIRIRGVSSISGNNNPLYVLDGFISGTDFNLNNLNVNDIESIEILKDATALSIYGTRGAAGVILITTKDGSRLAKGKTHVSINHYTTIQKLANKIEIWGGEEFANYKNEEAQFIAGASGFGETDPSISVPFPDPKNVPNTDWIDLVSQNGLINNTDLSISGMTDNTNYYVSLNRFNQKGILRGSSIERITLRNNLDVKVSDKVKIGYRINLSKFKKENNKVDYENVLKNMLPVRTVYDDDGNYTAINPISTSVQGNPEANIQLRVDHDLVSNLVSNAYLEYEPFKDFRIKSTLGAELNSLKENNYRPGELPERAIDNSGGYGSIDVMLSQSILNENTFNYSIKIADHSIKVLGGFTWQKNVLESSSQSADGFPNDVVQFNNLAFGSDANSYILGSDYSQRSYTSILGRINYGYKE